MSQLKNAAAVTLKGAPVAKLTIRGKLAWEKSRIINWLPRATDADRSTIYNGIGYKLGTRLSSSGTEDFNATYLSKGVCASGFIPAKPGDILRIKGFQSADGVNHYVIAYNSSNTKTGYVNISTVTSPFALTLDAATFGSNFNAIRFCVRNLTAESIVTINHELP